MSVTRLSVSSETQNACIRLLESKCSLLANPSVWTPSFRQLCDTNGRTTIRALPSVVHSFRAIIHPIVKIQQ
jgi:hypothetical protein